MVYTHYITKRPNSIDDGVWSLIITDFLTLQDELKGIMGGKDGDGEAQINRTDPIVFNGRGDAAMVDFVFKQVDHDQPSNTPTGQRPYDLAVCCGLLILKYHLKQELEVSTQGGFEDWKDAFSLYKYLFDRPAPKVFEEQGKQLRVAAVLHDLTDEEIEEMKDKLKEILGKNSEKHYIRII